MKRLLRIFSVLSLMFLSACSLQDWSARFYMFRAESSVDKATGLKSRKISFEDRKVYYVRACGDFIKAYQKNISVFTLTRIEMAADTCWKAGDPEKEDVFREYEKEYIKNHPQEYEYGDSGVGMMEMG